MEYFAVLVGNDINNINIGNSWRDLLLNLTHYLAISVDFEPDKPFPLAYEEIYFKAAKSKKFSDGCIKKFIADHVNKIGSSSIHKEIVNLNTNHILTTNYDLCLELSIASNAERLTNNGFITESKYSIFRNHKVNNKVFWHIQWLCKCLSINNIRL